LLTLCEQCHPIVERERSVFLDRKRCDTPLVFRERK
jgi:hypothetical protein